jgi:tetratricopeptide (TPR) repeat protein
LIVAILSLLTGASAQGNAWAIGPHDCRTFVPESSLQSDDEWRVAQPRFEAKARQERIDPLPHYCAAVAYHISGDAMRAVPLYEEAAKLSLSRELHSSSERASYLVALGKVRLDLHLNREAIQAYAKAVELNPKIIQAWLDLGYLYTLEKELRRAKDAYSKLLALEPDNLTGLVESAAVARESKLLNEALSFAKHSVEKHPNAFESHASLGSVYLAMAEESRELKNVELAMTAYTTARQVSRDKKQFSASIKALEDVERVREKLQPNRPVDFGVKGLLGQWRSVGGITRYFISNDEFAFTELLTPMLRQTISLKLKQSLPEQAWSPATRFKMECQKCNSNPRAEQIMKVNYNKGSEDIRVFKLGPGGRTLSMQVNLPSGESVTELLVYVDEATRPEASGLYIVGLPIKSDKVQ